MGDNTSINIGGSIFWIIFLLLSLGSLIWLGIWSFHNNNIKGIALVVIFAIMIITGIIFSRFEIFNSGTWSNNSFVFMLGLLLFWFIGSQGNNTAFSFLSVSENGLFSTISSELPRVLEFVMHAFIIPISEETFWVVGLPLTILALMTLIGKKYAVAKNAFVQMFVVVVIGGITFAAFHVGKLFISFLVAAFVFRTLMLLSTIGDMKFNLIPGLELTPAFAVGAHIGNNWGTFGVANGFEIIFSNVTLLLVFLLLAVPIVLGAANQAGLYIGRGVGR